DIWAMKMQNYISSTDLQYWNIVQKGNSQKNTSLDTEGNIIITPHVTIEEHMQVQREEKTRTMLLTAMPDEHMGDFYHMIDAKQIWSAIKARFGTNSTVPDDDAVPADAVPATSILVVVGIPLDSEFALMNLPSKVSLPVMCPLCNDAKSKFFEPDYQAQREQLNDCVKLLDQASVEKQDLMVRLENEKSINAKWLSTSKNLHKLVDSSITAKTKSRLGFTKVNHYKGVPPPMNGNYMPTSTSPDTAESPRPYGKQTSESTKIKSTSKNINFSFDFSDWSSVPTAIDLCVESARPNNVVNDSEDFTSRTSTSGFEEQVDNVCSPQEALSSSTSLGIDV
nr:xylulose kinase-1 [Tanacetum cinerariifolium]